MMIGKRATCFGRLQKCQTSPPKGTRESPATTNDISHCSQPQNRLTIEESQRGSFETIAFVRTLQVKLQTYETIRTVRGCANLFLPSKLWSVQRQTFQEAELESEVSKQFGIFSGFRHLPRTIALCARHSVSGGSGPSSCLVSNLQSRIK